MEDRWGDCEYGDAGSFRISHEMRNLPRHEMRNLPRNLPRDPTARLADPNLNPNLNPSPSPSPNPSPSPSPNPNPHPNQGGELAAQRGRRGSVANAERRRADTVEAIEP